MLFVIVLDCCFLLFLIVDCCCCRVLFVTVVICFYLFFSFKLEDNLFAEASETEPLAQVAVVEEYFVIVSVGLWFFL